MMMMMRMTMAMTVSDNDNDNDNDNNGLFTINPQKFKPKCQPENVICDWFLLKESLQSKTILFAICTG